jgi:undecaprenyl-diphosphatase
VRAPTYSEGTTPSSDPASSLAATISFFADYGMIVALVSMLEVLRGRRNPIQAFLRLAILGIPIAVVTSLSKRLVGRDRPEAIGDAPLLVRPPSSSSFPSGHTLAAAASAVAIPSTPLGFGVGAAHLAAVGWSRLRLHAHYPSDVIGGAAIGLALGLTLRPILRAVDRNTLS